MGMAVRDGRNLAQYVILNHQIHIRVCYEVQLGVVCIFQGRRSCKRRKRDKVGSSKIVSEIFKDVGQEKNVRKKIVIMIILETFHVVVSPNLFCSIVIFLGEGFVV